MSKREMTCARVEPLLEPYFEGALSKHQEAAVAAHVQACPRCSWELVQIEKTAAALAAVPRTAPSVDLAQQISARLAALPAPVSRQRLVAGWRQLEALAGVWILVLACIRYVVPWLLSKEQVSVPLLGWVKYLTLTFVQWLIAAPHALHGLVIELRDLLEALRLASAAVAPTVGFYAVAEVALIATVIIVTHRARRAAVARTFVL